MKCAKTLLADAWLSKRLTTANKRSNITNDYGVRTMSGMITNGAKKKQRASTLQDDLQKGCKPAII